MGRVHAMPRVTTRGSRKARILENSSSQPIDIRHKDNDFLTSKIRNFVENAKTFVEHQAQSKKLELFGNRAEGLESISRREHCTYFAALDINQRFPKPKYHVPIV